MYRQPSGIGPLFWQVSLYIHASVQDPHNDNRCVICATEIDHMHSHYRFVVTIADCDRAAHMRSLGKSGASIPNITHIACSLSDSPSLYRVIPDVVNVRFSRRR